MTPQQIFEGMCARWLANLPTFEADSLADDVVIETPFAAPGHPTRTEGKQAVLAYTRAGRASFPVRFDDCRGVVVHETADPEVIVVEYELVGTHTVTGVTASAPFIGVLRTRDGKLAHWREYQHTLAIAGAAGPA
ncbi:nuclear transport factor 2 family protein [Micromonospora sp. C32]|uniref:nuclear transport factor 2 family protein n=1 Tax=unclassified Micromonospora TaxID=2617518 RepID=UPI001B36B9C4|nr:MULTISPECIES: nuclear transport factor 2 family protein [unclassified Micromonospora]MBQ1041169.1 nuclear transport factor 2 family protein [Micromonospora sp. C72]MBQ1055031.1 nuclear transport factor 2 family protein [Micromonospora sp. C32]